MAFNDIYWAVVPRYGDLETTEEIYSVLPALKGIDIAYTICMALLIVFAIITRQRLARYKSNGPNNYITLCLSPSALNILYAFTLNIVYGIRVPDIITRRELIPMIVMVIYAVIMYKYFKKRRLYFSPELN